MCGCQILYGTRASETSTRSCYALPALIDTNSFYLFNSCDGNIKCWKQMLNLETEVSLIEKISVS